MVSSYEPIDLFPGGQVQYHYVASDGGTDKFDHYTENVLDEFDRVSETKFLEDGTTTHTKTVYTYENETGRVEKEVLHAYNEKTTTTETYETEFVFDELGRITERHEYGTETTVQRKHFTHYDGLGRVYETYAHDPAGAGTDGVKTRNTYDLAGRLTAGKRGLSFATAGTYEHTTYVYDRKGRTLTATQEGDSDADRVTTREYDGIDRVTSVTRSAGTMDDRITDYVYDFEDGLATITVTDSLGR